MSAEGEFLLQPISTFAPPLSGSVVASQRWSDLTFVHWRVEPERVAPLLPAGIRPDIHAGSSWIGLIPFRLDKATLWGSPAIAHFGDFVEINVRLYGVDDHGRRGVVFVSLEASRVVAVLAARAAFSLPYHWARTTLVREGDAIVYESSRLLSRDISSRVVARPTMVPVQDDPTAAFLTARWGLFARRAGRTILLPNSHEPWPLVHATLVSIDDTLLARAGFPELAARTPDSVLYSSGVTTRFGRAQ